MTVLVPTSLDEALAAMSESHAVALAGGTDLMVEVNEGHRRFPGEPDGATVVSLTRVPELSTWTIDRAAGIAVLGAGITWSEIEQEPLCGLLPALAQAARTVGSPQIRHAGTVGGNLATCSPAGDGLPVLAALDAEVRLASASRTRTMPVAEFMVGVKRTALEPGELVESITLPLLDGWQGYSKVGVRNAMVIATASACVAVDAPGRSVRIALGSVAPTVIRCPDAERSAVDAVEWGTGTLSPDAAREIGRLAAEDSRPIDDHRSTASYRRHAVGIMVARLLARAFPEDGS
jgi:CO/xanthine dehydrogenase FAD-binding subunit